MKLPPLVINNKEINRISSIKFLRVLIDEHLTWKERIALIEKEISKNLGILYRAKRLLDTSALKIVIFRFCTVI